MTSKLKNSNVFVAIMAGGIGSRFWPESTVSKPKQFLDILGTGQSLLQMTYERFLPFCQTDQILVVTNDLYKHLVQEQLPDILEKNILCEPSKNNTAPSVAYTSLRINAQNPDALIVMTPADHVILKPENFKRSIQAALNRVNSKEHLVTLGITPHKT